jgi:glycyl-tRNA synthetase
MTEMKDIVSLAKRRGFAYPGSEIYGGFANSYTYGPYGVELKNNIKKLWWETFVHNRPEISGIDGDIILHPKTWQASGHLDNFNDQLVDCKDCRARLRADHLLEEQAGIDAEGLSDEEVTKLIKEKGVKCPVCGSTNFTDVRKFNLMFQTQMAKTSEGDVAYLRPETAQAMFLEFKNIVDSMRVKLPFGIAQIGKAFRNEITPGNFIFRRLEFEQMEIEYFIHEEDWKQIFEEWYKAMEQWCDTIGLSQSKCHIYEHPKEKLSHYSKRTIDIEYDFPFGQKELYGLAYRTDFDLAQHEEHSKQTLRFFDEEKKEKIRPHVIEPTFGLDRTVLALLCEAYTEEKIDDKNERIVMKFVPSMAPVKCAVMPLMKKDGLPEIAENVFKKVKLFGNCEMDISGSVGKRYRRQDEIGTPVCITIDYETKDDDSVTVRDRDTMGQERVQISELVNYLQEKYFA